MSFFEGLVAPDPESQPAPPEEHRLVRYTPPGEGRGEAHPPRHWFVPAWVEHLAEAGRGPEARVMLNGWEVWRHSVTLHMAVFLKVTRPNARLSLSSLRQRSSDGLRCGLLLSDGRRITTLDGQPWPGGHRDRPTLTLGSGMGGGHYYAVNLHLSQLPPGGALRLVVEWPDQGVPETWTDLDADTVRAAASRVVEVWPDLEPPQPQGHLQTRLVLGHGPLDIMAPAPVPRPYTPPSPQPPVPERGDWVGMGRHAWDDLDLVKARLARGADPNHRFGRGETVLHLAAENGSSEVIAELTRLGADVDAAADPGGATPLWYAVCHGKADNATALLAAGADPWKPVVGRRSAGWLALRTPFASIFETLPGYVPMSDAERAEQAEADAHARVFRGLETEGLSVAFVSDVTEEEVVRRLGSTPELAPVLDLAAAPGPHGTGPGGFDPYDWDTAERFLGVTEVDGGCVVVQPAGYRASTPAVLTALSPGTKAYGLYFNPKGGTFGRWSVDGRDELREEIGLSVQEDDPEPQWLYRLWDWNREKDMWSAPALAYAATMAGVRVTDGTVISRPPRRWVELVEGSPLLAW